MPKATPIPATAPRRSMLAGAAALLASAPFASPALAAAATNPDAELIALCARFEVMERACLAEYAKQEAYDEMSQDEAVALEELSDARIDPIKAEMEPLYKAMHDLRATTLEGVLAKARAFNLWSEREIERQADNGEGCAHDLMMWGVWRDLLALGASQGVA